MYNLDLFLRHKVDHMESHGTIDFGILIVCAQLSTAHVSQQLNFLEGDCPPHSTPSNYSFAGLRGVVNP